MYDYNRYLWLQLVFVCVSLELILERYVLFSVKIMLSSWSFCVNFSFFSVPRVNKQETHKQTNKQTVTKWLNTFTMGKCRKWIFLFTINIHRKQIIKFKKIILRFSEWHNAEGTIFSNYIKQEFLTHETKLAYALSLEHWKNIKRQPYI